MLASMLKEVSSMSLEEKQRLLIKVRQTKMMLRSNIPQNKEDLDLVRKDVPKPPSPTTKLQQKQKKRTNATESRKKTNSHIPVLKQRSGKEIEPINLEKKAENSVEKHVRWDDVNLVQVSSPLIKHSPISAKEKRAIKSCLKPTN
ncbi:hypothetical protein F8M41_008079 [Gigaspora margarita]|uniref:Uncharacterized protein n=1 Tax=Gigaspora margarita TaxID=4874 RepID=A0A8H4A2W4_GIGMA|nr:hypothetical protein F8M41_008079 [Gigaspora margarita]